MKARVFEQNAKPLIVIVLTGSLIALFVIYSSFDMIAGVTGALALLIVGRVLFNELGRRENGKWLVNVLTLNLAVKLILVLSKLFFIFYPRSDSCLYDYLGQEFAAHLRQGEIVLDLWGSTGVNSYSILTGFIYAIFGHSWLLMQAINCLASTLGVFFYYKAFKSVMSVSRLRIATYLVAFTPSIILWTSLHLREPWAFLMIGIFAYGATSMMQKTSVSLCIAIAVSLIGLLLLRPYIAAVGVVSLLPVILSVIKRIEVGNLTLLVRIVLIFAITSVGIYVFLQAQYLAIHGKLSLNSFSGIRRGSAYGGSALPKITYSSWVELLFHLPRGVINVLFRPFLWEAHSLPALLASLENTFLLQLSLLSIWKWGSILQKTRNFWPLFMFMVLLLGVYAAAGGNLGLLFRERIQLLPFFLALGALGLWPWVRDSRNLGI